MRNFAWACLVLFTGCFDSGYGHDHPQQRCFGRDCDEPSRGDLSASSGDLGIAGAACTGYRDCIETCVATRIDANLTTCSASCKPSSSTAAVAAYDDAVACGRNHCLGNADAGTAGKCVLATDGTTLLNEDGTPLSPTDTGTGQKRCNLCLSDSLADLYGASCTDARSPDCEPDECAATTSACLSN